MTAVLVTLASVVGVLLVLLIVERRRSPAPAHAVHVAPDLSAVDGSHAAVLVFLTSTCTTCGALWAKLASSRGDLPSRARVVVVTKGEESEDPRRVRRLAPRGMDVVMSTAAWDRYRVAT
ncbi:MAG TPA: hypothetical protein VIH82_10945, partial [Acidimicrobiia bacterium]